MIEQIESMKFVGSADQQKRLNLLSETMAKKKFCDLTVTVGPEKKQFKVHRFILAEVSPVFEVMLYHCQFNGALVLENVACDVFESALCFCYCSDPKVTENNVVGVIQFADKYQMDGLLDWGMRCLAACLNDLNFCVLFNRAVKRNQRQSLTICRKYIADKTNGFDRVFESAGFNKMSAVAMRELIKSNEIGVNEQKLWGYLVKWAENASSEMNELDDDAKYDEREKIERLRGVYDLARFGLMSNEFIATKVEPENVLSDQEMVSIFLFINGGNGMCGQFDTTKRKTAGLTKQEWKNSLKVGDRLDVFVNCAWQPGTVKRFYRNNINKRYVAIQIGWEVHHYSRNSDSIRPLK